jgi:hypothetical protein
LGIAADFLPTEKLKNTRIYLISFVSAPEARTRDALIKALGEFL